MAADAIYQFGDFVLEATERRVSRGGVPLQLGERIVRRGEGGGVARPREFAREHSERLWKQLVIAGDPDPSANTVPAETLVVLCLAVAAALVGKMPALFGHPISPNEEFPPFYARNASLFVFP